jgi:hypothetical protein
VRSRLREPFYTKQSRLASLAEILNLVAGSYFCFRLLLVQNGEV